MKKKRVIISLIIVFLISLIVLLGKVSADEYDLSIGTVTLLKNGVVGDKLKIDDLGDVRSRSNIHCFEHRGELSEGTYTIYEVIEFDGKTVTINGSSVTCNENATMAYLFSKGNYSYGIFHDSSSVLLTGRNIAMWAYQNTWLSKVNLNQNWKRRKQN